MTFEELNKVNKKLEAIDLKGKGYVQVHKRIMAFRELFPMGTVSTEILNLENGVVVMKATVQDEEGKVLGTGLAYEKESSGYVNKTSYIENCETSAVGRALAMCGIGVDASMCSAEELVNAVINQEKEEKPTARSSRKPTANRIKPKENVSATSIEEANKAAEAYMQELITDKQALEIKQLMLKHKIPFEAICRLYKKKRIEDMTREDRQDFYKNGEAFMERWENEYARAAG